jgi:hypothetical protein
MIQMKSEKLTRILSACLSTRFENQIRVQFMEINILAG